jgi:hypothetical protein
MLRIYVDTSVFGGVLDEEFRAASRGLIKRAVRGEVRFLLSGLAVEELTNAPQGVKDAISSIPRQNMERVPVGAEARSLAAAYVTARVVPAASEGDALHVAAATVAGANLIVSWNFKHIVNYRRIQLFNSVNLAMGCPLIDIRSPLELEEDDEN